MSIRGIYSSVTKIRRDVFSEVARLAYEDEDLKKRIEKLPYKILPGEEPQYRESIFLERAIVEERIRLAIGLPLREIDELQSVSDGIEESAIAEKYYDDPLINIIKFACHGCPDNKVVVSDQCQGCLAHPCIEVCPKKCISMVNGKSVIDQDLCIKCGRCVEVCPYKAIVKMERPCAKSCGVDAISSDHLGRADIDYDKCVSCGMCLANCPFGAISDKGQIFQVIHAMKHDHEVIAAVAPSFVGQFGASVTPNKLKNALMEIGFSDVVEVAVGADLCTIEEAEDFMNKVPKEQPFMATSCCPAWSVMAKKNFPEFKPYISMALTPMVLTGRLIKKEKPNAKVVFIGPCAAKKLEASRKSVKSDIDFVLTYEETMGMFEAKGVNLREVEAGEDLNEGTAAGRGFAVSGGVANAVKNAILKDHPEREVNIEGAEGLRNCKAMLQKAKAGKLDGYLLEGMACPGGCVAGAGTLQTIAKSSALVKKYASDSDKEVANQSEYKDNLDLLTKEYTE